MSLTSKWEILVDFKNSYLNSKNETCKLSDSKQNKCNHFTVIDLNMTRELLELSKNNNANGNAIDVIFGLSE